MTKGITIKVENGDQRIEISIGSDVSPEHLKILQKVLQTIAEKTNENKKRKENRKKTKRKNSDSIFFKVRMLVLERLANGQWFTSLDLRELYEEIYNEPLPANSASTYLRRMESLGMLTSRKYGKLVEYRVVNEVLTQKT